MTSPPSEQRFYCPDCGTPVADGVGHCPNGHRVFHGTLTRRQPDSGTGSMSVGGCLVMLVVVLLTLLAAPLAFLMTCSSIAHSQSNEGAVLGASALAAGAVLVIGTGVGLLVARLSRKKRKWRPTLRDWK